MRMLNFFTLPYVTGITKKTENHGIQLARVFPAKRRDVPRASTESNLHNLPHAKSPPQGGKLLRCKDYSVSPLFLTSLHDQTAIINEIA